MRLYHLKHDLQREHICRLNPATLVGRKEPLRSKSTSCRKRFVAYSYTFCTHTRTGYGHIAPKTDAGKIVTILYAIVGIPLTLLFLSNIGEVMATIFRYVVLMSYHEMATIFRYVKSCHVMKWQSSLGMSFCMSVYHSVFL